MDEHQHAPVRQPARRQAAREQKGSHCSASSQPENGAPYLAGSAGAAAPVGPGCQLTPVELSKRRLLGSQLPPCIPQLLFSCERRAGGAQRVSAGAGCSGKQVHAICLRLCKGLHWPLTFCQCCLRCGHLLWRHPHRRHLHSSRRLSRRSCHRMLHARRALCKGFCFGRRPLLQPPMHMEG